MIIRSTEYFVSYEMIYLRMIANFMKRNVSAILTIKLTFVKKNNITIKLENFCNCKYELPISFITSCFSILLVDFIVYNRNKEISAKKQYCILPSISIYPISLYSAQLD